MSSSPPPTLRLNPGGALRPAEVVGRDGQAAAIWDVLERQSVLLTAERRMGKTSLLKKMADEGRPAHVPILRNLQDVATPHEFVRHLLADVETGCPNLLLRDKSLRKRLERAGVRKIGVSAISVEFEPASEESWKDVVRETFTALDRDQEERIVFLWDELRHMLQTIAGTSGPLVGRELLDLLRAGRENHAAIRMVFSGSLGLHHVVTGLRHAGGAWTPVNDMRLVDLPPLTQANASFLASELLRNEGVACGDSDAVAVEIAEQVDGVPYYVHLTVQALLERARRTAATPAERPDVSPLVEERLRDPLDPWQLMHYVDRLADYYGDDAPAVKALLDALAVTARPVAIDDLRSLVGAEMVPPDPERFRDLLTLLGRDHYVVFDGGAVGFRLELLRRAWLARRRL
jgi:hypothetical protein